MEKDKIFISVITVCFNSEKTIKKTIDSVLKQTLKNFEYILVDGKSTDNTLQIIKSYENEFYERNIPYKIISEKDNGIYDAINKGISLCNGKLVGILNSDDWYQKDTLETIYEKYSKDEADVYHANLNIYSSHNKFIIEKTPNTSKAIYRKMPFFHPTCFIKKEVYNTIGNYSLKYKICSDYDFIIKLIKSNYKIVYINKALVNFRLGGASTTSIDNALQEAHKVRVDNSINPFQSKMFYYLEKFICFIKY